MKGTVMPIKKDVETIRNEAGKFMDNVSHLFDKLENQLEKNPLLSVASALGFGMFGLKLLDIKRRFQHFTLALVILIVALIFLAVGMAFLSFVIFQFLSQTYGSSTAASIMGSMTLLVGLIALLIAKKLMS